jgi:hypothetical protein
MKPTIAFAHSVRIYQMLSVKQLLTETEFRFQLAIEGKKRVVHFKVDKIVMEYEHAFSNVT